MNLKVENGQLLIKDIIMGLLDAKTLNSKKSDDADIVYCNYIPLQLPPEEAKKRNREFRAGKTYARVSLKHPDPVAVERGESFGTERSLMEIRVACLKLRPGT